MSPSSQLLCHPAQRSHHGAAIAAETIGEEVDARHQVGDLAALTNIIQRIVAVGGWVWQGCPEQRLREYVQCSSFSMETIETNTPEMPMADF